jgi:hypothetical protein
MPLDSVPFGYIAVIGEMALVLKFPKCPCDELQLRHNQRWNADESWTVFSARVDAAFMVPCSNALAR